MSVSAFRLLSVDQSGRSFVVWTSAAIVVAAAVFLTWAIDRDAYVWLGMEDGLGENLTAVFYLIAGVLILALAVRKIRSGFTWKHQLLPLLLGLLFLWVAGEEISWGQRIFGFATPESMQGTNVQNEFNLHNLGLVSGKSALIDQHRLFNLFMLFNGILLPLAYRFWRPARRVMNRLNFPIVTIACVSFFVFAFLHGLTLSKIYRHWAEAEIRELIFSLGFLVASVAIYRETNRLE